MAPSGISAWSGRGLQPSRCLHADAGACNTSGLWRGPNGADGVLGWDTGQNRSRGGAEAERAESAA
ncbi:hypothetical protein T09_275, partial [Trichinella sp. T9]